MAQQSFLQKGFVEGDTMPEQIIAGGGLGVIWNGIDRSKSLNGKLTNMGIVLRAGSATQQPVSLNATDALTYVSAVGLSFSSGRGKKGGLMKGLIVVGAKKLFEFVGMLPVGNATTLITPPLAAMGAPPPAFQQAQSTVGPGQVAGPLTSYGPTAQTVTPAVGSQTTTGLPVNYI